MDRRERYDPEDIEHLMAERPFAELLPEERAYVLRHLSGAEEYEAMRALLLHLKEGPDESAPLEADPVVRDRVMAAFRDAREPRWRVWLNSVGALFAPQDGFALWRPALALATLALLVVVTVVVVQRSSTEEREIAELKPVAPVKEESSTPVARSEEPARAGDAIGQEPVTATVSEAVQAEERKLAAATKGQGLASDLEQFAEAAESPAVADKEALDTMADDMAVAEDERPVEREAVADLVTLDLEAVPSSAGRVVTTEELSRNMSVTNATGKVRAAAPADPRKRTQPAQGRTLAQEPVLLDLVATGW